VEISASVAASLAQLAANYTIPTRASELLGCRSLAHYEVPENQYSFSATQTILIAVTGFFGMLVRTGFLVLSSQRAFRFGGLARDW